MEFKSFERGTTDIIKNKDLKRIGIMGGTFDPIHIGHLFIAEEVRTKLKLDKVIFVPSGSPPHKDSKKVSDAKHRYLMTLFATVTNPNFEVSSIEVDREGTTYTIDTIKAFKKIYKNDAEFYFITGADAIMELSTWKEIDKLLKLCRFVAASRPGFRAEKMKEKIKELEKKYNESIYTVVVPALQISSTDIRNRIRDDRSIKYLLPESVEHYINKNRLYR